MSKSIFKAVLAWAQLKLNQQRTARMLSPLPEYICNLPGIKDILDAEDQRSEGSSMEGAGGPSCESYLLNPPLAAMLSAAGYDHSYAAHLV